VGDGLDMNVDVTSHEMNVLTAIGEDMDVVCRSSRADISWFSGALGKGPMGARFMDNYKPGRASVEHQMDTSIWATVELANAGRHCVDVYLTADAHAEAELLRVRFA
jgi:hypothetical protein